LFIKRTPYFLLICITWILSGCNETFEPWQENDQYHFSMFGYLDASADTQWVRILPVREELFLEPRPLDFIVTMEHAESGESIVMQDSLFSYFQGYAWNFRSEMDIRPGQTYRITASHPDGRSSHTTVQLPEDFPTPILHTIPGGISNIENGTGYVAGIVSKTIPYESCFDENFQFIACDLLPPPW